MFANAVLLLAVISQSPGDPGVISGVAVNGTVGGLPLVDAQIVLRASREGAFVPVAETTTDAAGNFTFADLPLDHDTIYLAGVNRAGVHYPGPRIRLAAARPAASVKLVAYDAVESPSPLRCERHEIRVNPGAGFIEVSELLVIANPSLTAYVGPSAGGMPSVTLRLALPDGFDKVTFDKEFHGRNFQIHDGQLVTLLPWPPGRRELQFNYRLPVEQRPARYQRTLDLPTDKVALTVATANRESITCSLPTQSSQQAAESCFAHRGSQLPAGHLVELRIGTTPLGFDVYGRWIALAALIACAVGATIFFRQRMSAPLVKTGGSQHSLLREIKRPPRRLPVNRVSRPSR